MHVMTVHMPYGMFVSDPGWAKRRAEAAASGRLAMPTGEVVN
jgi:hypothetical protein